MLTYVFAVFLALVGADTHVDKKVSVKEVVFDSPVADLIWLAPENRVVLARTHEGMFFLYFCLIRNACRSFISQRQQR